MSDVVDMPHKYVPPPLELVKSRIEEVIPPAAQEENARLNLSMVCAWACAAPCWASASGPCRTSAARSWPAISGGG